MASICRRDIQTLIRLIYPALTLQNTCHSTYIFSTLSHPNTLDTCTKEASQLYVLLWVPVVSSRANNKDHAFVRVVWW
jgi:hypothetical protein